MPRTNVDGFDGYDGYEDNNYYDGSEENKAVRGITS